MLFFCISWLGCTAHHQVKGCPKTTCWKVLVWAMCLDQESPTPFEQHVSGGFFRAPGHPLSTTSHHPDGGQLPHTELYGHQLERSEWLWDAIGYGHLAHKKHAFEINAAETDGMFTPLYPSKRSTIPWAGFKHVQHLKRLHRCESKRVEKVIMSLAYARPFSMRRLHPSPFAFSVRRYVAGSAVAFAIEHGWGTPGVRHEASSPRMKPWSKSTFDLLVTCNGRID